MTRALWLYVIAALLSACGQSGGDASQATSAESSATAPAAAASGVIPGSLRQNRYVKLAATEGGFSPEAHGAPAGFRYYVVGLRGMGRAQNNIFELDVTKFVSAQNEGGCIAHPDLGATWLKNPLGERTTFETSKQTEGQLAFLMPEDSQHVRVLIAPASDDGLAIPAGDDFTPSWPTPVQTIEDGSTLRLLVLPFATPPASLPPAAAGQERVVLDVVIENLKTQGIEFTTSQALRFEMPAGHFIQPSPLTQQLTCRLDDGDVVPPGHSRRLMLVYDLPGGQPRRLQYRGFEVDQVSVDLTNPP